MSGRSGERVTGVWAEGILEPGVVTQELVSRGAWRWRSGCRSMYGGTEEKSKKRKESSKPMAGPTKCYQLLAIFVSEY